MTAKKKTETKRLGPIPSVDEPPELCVVNELSVGVMSREGWRLVQAVTERGHTLADREAFHPVGTQETYGGGMKGALTTPMAHDETRYVMARSAESSVAKAWGEVADVRETMAKLAKELREAQEAKAEQTKALDRVRADAKSARDKADTLLRELNEAEHGHDLARSRGAKLEGELGKAREFFGAERWAAFRETAKPAETGAAE